MLRHPPGRGYYDWPPPSVAEMRSRGLRWLGLVLAAAGVLALVSFVLVHDDAQPGLSDRGWFTLAAAALLLVALGIHHRLGALALLRAVAEYAVVALLAVLLTIAATGHGTDQPATETAAQPPTTTTAPPTTKPPTTTPPPANQGGATAKGTGAGCPPVKQVFAWVGCLWRQANPPQLPGSPPSSTRRTP
jgi:hypothetical protein